MEHGTDRTRTAGRRALLRLTAAGGALLAGVGAGAAGRRAAAQQGAPLVGSWQVSMLPQGSSDPFQMLATFAADGTAVLSSPALSLHSTAHGAWSANQDGSFAVRAAFYIFLASQPRTQILGAMRMTLTVGGGGSSFSGPFDMQLVGPDGATIGDELGTAQGTRI